MSLLHRYILFQVIIAVLIILSVPSVAIWLVQLLRFIDLIVGRGLPVSIFFWIAILVLPSLVSVVMPFAFFAAVLIVYNRLMADSELIVIRAAGIGTWRMISPALVIALIGTSAMYGLNLYLVPASYRVFKDLQYDLRNNYINVLVQEGVFNELRPDLTLYVRERGQDNTTLYGVMVSDQRLATRNNIWIAERGTIVNSAGMYLELQNGVMHDYDRKTGQLALLYFETYLVELNKLTVTNSTNRQRNSTERYFDELLAADDISDPLVRNAFYAEAHQRLASPLAIISFTFIALAAVLSSSFSRRGKALPILLASAIITVLHALSIGLNHLMVRMPNLMPLPYLVYFFSMGIAIYYLFRPTTRTPSKERKDPKISDLKAQS